MKYAVASGRLREGDRLGSIRDVAVQIRANRNTVARAYSDLERESVIRSRPGQGSFISDSGPDIGQKRARKILSDAIDEVLAQARQFRMTQDDVLSLVRERLSKVDLGGA